MEERSMHGVLQSFQSEYTEDNFWRKLRRTTRLAGREVVEKALCLYYAAQRPETPAWARAAVYAALGYFILPTDAVFDPLPLLGYTDDLSALALAITTIAAYIDPPVRAKAKEKTNRWFG